MAETKHTPEAVEASNQITGCQKVEAGGLSLAGMRNIIDREVSQPLQSRIDCLKDELKVNINAMNAASAKIDRLEAEKAELVTLLKRLDAWVKRGYPPDSTTLADILKDTRALLAKAEPQ